MRIFNQAELKADFARYFQGPVNNENHNKFLTWLTESAVKWLLKNDKEFTDTFTSPVTVKPLTLFQTSSDTQLEAYNFTDAFGQKTRAYLETEFDIKDARNGILRAYVPKMSLTWWLSNNPKYKLIEVRDFVYELLDEKPDEDLRKYTLDQMPKHIERWHRELERRAEEKRKELQRELERQTERQQNFTSALLDVQTYTSLHPGMFGVVRQELLANAWVFLTEGVDYVRMGVKGDYLALRLLSADALRWEAEAKGSCIYSQHYINELGNNRSMYVSLREVKNPDVCLYTAELRRVANKWEPVQVEGWGWRFARHFPEAVESEVKRLAATKDILELARNYRSDVTSFTINRSI